MKHILISKTIEQENLELKEELKTVKEELIEIKDLLLILVNKENSDSSTVGS
ncbi:hypothetical protein MHB65_19910 [Lysinibacillus sp. FSL K6-0075]|uniref:hypothetical protein n=1 Tax=Lysinibacillus sp. FSL K6-0075 TaxID=2921415 RepID=UPI003157F629